jgi:DNA ligase (NAD+)
VLPSIPSKIPYMDELVIDGEIICTYTDFEKFSSEYKNPRNFAAGSIRLLDSKECASRNLTFVAWDILTPMYFNDGIEYRLDQKLNYLVPFGFTVVPYVCANGMFGSDQFYENTITEIQNIAKDKAYPIDGVVFKFTDCEYGRSLGETTHHFKNALAYKFYDETYISTLLNIEWTMGRTGALTPVAVFEPIDMDGSTVERASLHNVSIMDNLFGEKGPYIDQEIEVFKANMIIPQIACAKQNWNDKCVSIEIPKVCPICGGPTCRRTEISSTVLYCENPNCDGKLINRLDHFCGKKGLDIKGLSKATLEKLINWNWVNSISDLFDLVKYRNQWIEKAGFGEKSVNKILEAIDNGRTCDLSQFIAALGIPHIGGSVSKQIAREFQTWNEFIEAVTNDYKFYQMPGIGIELHGSLINFNYAEAIYIVDNYINFNNAAVNDKDVKSDKLKGLTFVITGKLNTFKNRDLVKEQIESLGGKVSSSISNNTSYLVNNDINSSSSKNISAKKLGIPIITEEQLVQMMESGI